MNYVYVVYDKTDSGHNKPFICICRNEEKANEVVDEMRSKRPQYVHKYIYYSIVPLE